MPLQGGEHRRRGDAFVAGESRQLLLWAIIAGPIVTCGESTRMSCQRPTMLG